MTSIASGDLAAWLAQVHGDPEIPASAFKLAFALTKAVDVAGLIHARAIAKIGDADLIKHLVDRGHLRPSRKGFQIVIRGRDKPSRRAKTAAVVPFPAARRRNLVQRLAAQMAVRPTADSEQHLRQELARHTRVLRRKGIDEFVIAREMCALESAVRAELWRQVLCPPQPGDAS